MRKGRQIPRLGDESELLVCDDLSELANAQRHQHQHSPRSASNSSWRCEPRVFNAVAFGTRGFCSSKPKLLTLATSQTFHDYHRIGSTSSSRRETPQDHVSFRFLAVSSKLLENCRWNDHVQLADAVCAYVPVRMKEPCRNATALKAQSQGAMKAIQPAISDSAMNKISG